MTVRPDGHISTALVTDEEAYGRTVPELTAALRQKYAKELKTPHVSVEVKSFAPTRVYVGGEVANPGEFVTVGPTLTLSQALARAGGPKVDGDEVKAFIIRRGPHDEPEFLSTSYRNVITGRSAAAGRAIGAIRPGLRTREPEVWARSTGSSTSISSNSCQSVGAFPTLWAQRPPAAEPGRRRWNFRARGGIPSGGGLTATRSLPEQRSSGGALDGPSPHVS